MKSARLVIDFVVSSACLACPTVFADSISIEITTGAWYRDGDDGDGLFDNGGGGPNHVIALDNRDPDHLRRIRTALEFDLSAAPKWPHVKSASLVPAEATAMGDWADWSVRADLSGYAADGVATSSDTKIDNYLAAFQLPYMELTGTLPTITINVTDFVRSLLRDGGAFAGFNFRVANEGEPDRFATAIFFGELAEGANDNAAYTPKLIITSPPVPERSTLTLPGDGIVGLIGYGWRGAGADSGMPCRKWIKLSRELTNSSCNFQP